MKLTLDQIKSVAWGAVRYEEKNGAVKLYRFTKEQEELYKAADDILHRKTLSTAGIKLVFKTDSESLFLRVNTSMGASQKFFSFDLFIDGKYVDSLDNFSSVELPKCYSNFELPLGEFSKNFSLGKGEKEVKIFFPWSVNVDLLDVFIDDGASLIPVKTVKKMISFGDSITHGYHALRSYKRYVGRLAEALGAEEVCKAIGAEKFWPELAQARDEFDPDYITVAYGTNDWCAFTKDVGVAKCRGFFDALVKNYPNARIFAITPIWRKDIQKDKKFGAFTEMEALICDTAKEYKNISVIRGLDLVPHSEDYFGDLCLHPNDEGFEHYYNNLLMKIEELI